VVVRSLGRVRDHVWWTGDAHAGVGVDDGDGVAGSLDGSLGFRLVGEVVHGSAERRMGVGGEGGRGGRRLDLML
jgi:hypothetical protein